MKILVPNGKSYSKNHMTEEDTFIRLRRIPYEEMYEIYLQWFFANREAKTLDVYYGELRVLLEPYGWTLEQFNKY